MDSLDNVDIINNFDSSNQINIMIKWPELIDETLATLEHFAIKPILYWKGKTFNYRTPSSVVICGMGGSAIAGDYLIDGYSNIISVPVLTNRSYSLPHFVDNSTLVLCVSYSGNTEETISCYYDAIVKGAMVISISSGGILEEISKLTNLPHIFVKKGQPPRTALPMIYLSLLHVFTKLDLLPPIDEQIQETKSLLKQLGKEYGVSSSTSSNIAKQIAKEIHTFLPIFIGHTYLSAVVTRARTQLNENSKRICLSEVIPEQNHNGIVAWDHPKSISPTSYVIFLHDKETHPNISLRIHETKKSVLLKTDKVKELSPRGNSVLAKQFSLTYLVDFVSLYLAILEEVDPTATPSIDKLKEELRNKLNSLELIIEKMNNL